MSALKTIRRATVCAALALPVGLMAQTILKASDVQPAGYPNVVAIENLGMKLEAATNGKYKLQMFAGGVLGSEKEMIEQVQIGALQIARISLGPMGPIVDDVNVFHLPFLFHECHGRQRHQHGPQRHLLRTADRCRDGAENNQPTFFASNQYTAGPKYYSQTTHLIIPEIFVMSKITWDKMSKDEQALLMKSSREAQMEQRALWDKSVGEYTAKLKAYGIEFITLDKKPFYDATAPIRAKYGSQFADLIKRIEATK